VRGLDEVVSLVWKIKRRLELCDQVEESRIECRDAFGERSFELIKRNASLQWCRCLNQISDRFRLNEIALAVQKCAQREFARFREPCTRRNSALQHGLQKHRAAVSGDLDDVLAGVRTRRGEKRRDNFIDRRPIAVDAYARERRAPGLKRAASLEQLRGELRRLWSA
jgi:hypothetical protein